MSQGKELGGTNNSSPVLKCLRGSAPFLPVAALKTTVLSFPFPIEDDQILYLWAALKAARVVMCK